MNPFGFFKNEDGTYQDPNEKAIVFLVSNFLYREVKKSTQADLDVTREKEGLRKSKSLWI